MFTAVLNGLINLLKSYTNYKKGYAKLIKYKEFVENTVFFADFVIKLKSMLHYKITKEKII